MFKKLDDLGLDDNFKLNLEEGAVERKIYKLIHEYKLSYLQVKKLFEVVDTKLEFHMKNVELSPNKKPLDLTRGQDN
ncbi:hypothetical protein AST01_04320 [Staphylococcus equorum]|uniref:hypothetical protein n=1 Tax=Staphylococcus equorum TaxID=246432 RepID=UPI0008531E2C|nr:hypothetical protein [Staphylococcus equorum]OEK70159.1 hypothetical protein AST01_04320 [Staphylococcus equorum]